MKSTIKILVLLSVCLSLASCVADTNGNTTTESEYFSVNNNTTDPKVPNDVDYTTVEIDKSKLPEYVPGSVKLLPQKQPHGPNTTSFQYERKYRLIYYNTTNFNELVTYDQLAEWCSLYNPNMYEEEFDEMLLVIVTHTEKSPR